MYSTLSHFAVKPKSTIQLIVLLFEIPEKFNHVVFDLFWGYPTKGVDALDASCMMMNGKSLLNLCDFRNKHPLKKGISHTGDIFDNENRIGHQTIEVSLKEIPTEITHLFFTLSAFNSPNLSDFPNPSLRFYEKVNPNKALCNTTFQHAGSSQAVIMCYVTRNKNNRWEIFELGKESAGNANNYEPLVKTITCLVI